MADAAGHSTTYAYDALDRVIRTTLPKSVVGSPLDFTTTTMYDIQDFTGDPILYTEIRDPNGRVTRQGYDALGHLARSVDALGKVTSYGYLHNVLASITDANENVTAYDYDNRRRLARTTFPDGQYETYAYSSDDRLVTKTDRKGTTFDYAYDAFGRVTGETARVNGNVQATRNWSYNGQNLTGTGAPGASTLYTYDSLYRVLTETQYTQDPATTASMQTKITYTYPPNIPNQGVLRAIASYTVGPLSGGYSPRVDYVYNGGRVTDVLWSALNGGFHIDYNAHGGYSLITYPNGQLRSFAYDDQGRLTQVANTYPTLGDPGDLATFTYSYDHNWATGTETMLGQRTSVTVTGSPAANQLLGETRYTYDANYQLIRADYPPPIAAESWGYDAIGNRVTRQAAGSPVQTYVYEQNASGKNTQRLKTWTAAPPYVVYDANGNQTGLGTTTNYTWDVFNHLASADGGRIAYSYDASGRRVTRTAFSATTTWLYEGINTVGERNPVASLWNDYLFAPGIDEPLAMATGQNGPVTYFGVDGLGSVVIRTDSSANILDGARYSPWGEGNGVNALFGYTGREQSDGLWHFRAREYRADIGRFLSEDPIGLWGGGLNFYVYVQNEPTFGTDPFGLAGKWDQYCASLMRRIENLRRMIERAEEDLVNNPQNLPEFCPAGKPRESVEGHPVA